MEVYVLNALRQSYAVKMTTGEWVCPPYDYEIKKGLLIRELKDRKEYSVKIDGKEMFFEEYFLTQEEAEKEKFKRIRK